MPALPPFERGRAAEAEGRLEAAAAAYRQAITERPDLTEAHNNLGAVLLAAGNAAGAVEAFLEAIRTSPDMAILWFNLANAFRDAGRLDDAAAALVRSLQLDPDHVEASGNLGNVLLALGRPEDAITTYRFALSRRPDFAEAHCNLGIALAALGHLEDAVIAYRRALVLAPGLSQASANLGNALMLLGRMDEAADACRAALAIRPDFPEALATLYHANRHACAWDDWRGEQERLLAADRRHPGHIAPLVLLSAETDAAEHLHCATNWAKRLAMGVTPRREHAAPVPGERLRIGYLSADFHSHATAYLAAEMFECHDRGAFEVFGYSTGPDDSSPMRKRIEAAFDHFIDLRGISDAAAAERIFADGIHILVDLKGYTQGARTRILAARPAPIQVNYLGYPGTMGADFIDYVLADSFVLPMDRQPFYRERIVHLPGCYQCNDSHRAGGADTPDRAAFGLPAGGFVFCCFDNAFKITPPVFAAWMEVLAAVPGGVLWLLEANGSAAANLCREAAARGIDPARLIFRRRLPLAEHLASYRLADLFLDTLPYNGHTTASDALWEGLPVLTMAGDGFAGRVAGSLLSAVGLPEMIAGSLEEYREKAVELASRPDLLAARGRRLAIARIDTPLFDGRRFARGIEAAYRRMWAIHREGAGPQSFAVGAGDSKPK